ncbi:MAG: glycosyltransferase family 4 protein [Anaerolineae bacterium]|nr:glycosyltransferase family 4 protein [Anaerolineae bacterium]
MPDLRLLWFNLATDADASVQGFATDWINALAARCAAIDVVTMRAGRLAVADNVRVFSVGKEKGYGEARRAIEFYRILTRLLRERHYDACFAHIQALFAIMGAPLLKRDRIPITLWYAHKAVTPRLWLAEKLVDQVVTASPESFRLRSHKTRIIGHGIDTACFMPAPPAPEPFTIVSVSRIAPVKRLETIIEAASLLAQDGGEFRLRIIGNINPQDTAYAQELQQLAAAYHLADQVTFVGEVPHSAIVQEYQQAHLMVNMSNTGAVDKAVLEAMACGLPVITANEAFGPILADWREQLLVPMDSPGELAEKMRAMMATDLQARQALGQELRAVVVRDHSLDHLADMLVDLFSRGKA